MRRKYTLLTSFAFVGVALVLQVVGNSVDSYSVVSVIRRDVQKAEIIISFDRLSIDANNSKTSKTYTSIEKQYKDAERGAKKLKTAGQLLVTFSTISSFFLAMTALYEVLKFLEFQYHLKTRYQHTILFLYGSVIMTSVGLLCWIILEHTGTQQLIHGLNNTGQLFPGGDTKKKYGASVYLLISTSIAQLFAAIALKHL